MNTILDRDFWDSQVKQRDDMLNDYKGKCIMSSNMTVEDKIFQWASSNYLTEQMDDEVVISDDETMIAWIDDHKLEENAYQQAGYILNDIDILADSATRFFKSIREEL